ncbi:PadR family transcriptional regulator [Arthrobacter globiformis]|uniref:PadR family transcriptional regulator n=1 Tax=Arthrobacter globiformis TaxID=1665 RepID=UPI00278FC63B|nr:PadR family transcriptional regulator [Arthrobacter globiformis]MDQ0620509.1 PadR family transcriptional regulator PadR [Arthrobacter globiformis]
MGGIDWQQELTRAALPHAVLALLMSAEMHGYAMIEVLRAGGFPRTKGGTLYPLLRRLEEQGLVSHVWQHDSAGPGRKQFAITGEGRADLVRAADAWQQMDDALSRIRTSRQETP